MLLVRFAYYKYFHHGSNAKQIISHHANLKMITLKPKYQTNNTKTPNKQNPKKPEAPLYLRYCI